MGRQGRVCVPVMWRQCGTTVYKCRNVDDSIVTYDAGKFAYCPLCGGRVETYEPMSEGAKHVFDGMMELANEESEFERLKRRATS